MKKSKKLSMNELSETMEVMTKDMQKACMGGIGYVNYDSTLEERLNDIRRLSNYVALKYDIPYDYKYIEPNFTYRYGKVYSQEQYERIYNSGLWKGGLVEGMGYVLEGVSCFSTKGYYYNYHDICFLSNLAHNTASSFWGMVLGLVPYFGTAHGFCSSLNSNRNVHMFNSMLVNLHELGTYYITNSTTNPGRINIFDARSGNFITSISGRW